MQLIERPAQTSDVTLAIGPSIAVELSWVLLAAQRRQLRGEHPVLEAVYLGPHRLEERVSLFWGDEVADFGEQLILADEAGVIGSVDIDELLAGIAQAAVSRPRKLRLASEDEADRAVFGQRLDRLRRSPRLRRDYVQLLGELWAEVDVAWRANGLRLCEVAAERCRRRLEGGAKWLDIVIADSEHLSALLPGLVERVAPVSSVTITPSFFSGQGLLFDLPSGILVGIRATTTDPGLRRRSDLVARRLKALADPTRLAIACSLRGGSMTVGDIAKYFDLAQPTVSNHLKVLREAGMVSGTRRGNHLSLEVRVSAVDGLLDELKALLGEPGTEDRIGQ
ncbi:MAG: metalloregulator ArsR/SmtB family transcription factor [Acidimicrobiales bacterium]|jgi:ArsR family transcriptional regulator